eukprot:TRINITY_DN38062_c0_g1_i1.p1 TRINITY_DN38062_c0_g1~~TRINITY_DN38062_c0_g1_i1.p1  ORF type:complete len:263 (-),score=42.80 TRINITY_DN38062_c0_g1_i1:226-1014(-)
MSGNLVLVKKNEDGIAYVTINRTKSLNSLTRQMIVDLAKTFKSLDQDPKVKVIIFTGAGRAFCAGVDLTAAQDVFKGNVKNMDEDLVYQMEHCKKPIIGAVNGFAITGGFEIALACDILIGSTEAKFVDTHAKFGIFPSWGLSQKLPRLIGANRAREVSFTALPIDAQTAEKWGILSRVVPPAELLSTAEYIAKAIIQNNEDLVLGYKGVLNDGINLSLGDGLKLEKERGHKYYSGMRPEQFKKMQEFIAKQSKKTKPASKL